MVKYDGIDPLNYHETDGNDLLEIQKKRGIDNILKSYTGFFDVFSELIQNSLDATELKFKSDISGYNPTIKIRINLKDNSILVADNGIGMNKRSFEFCLAPHFSFKQGLNLRGNKGVGATFLAYGFNSISIYTKSSGFEAAVSLLGGRQWVIDPSQSDTPRFIDIDPFDDFIQEIDTGSVFYIVIGEQRPSLSYVGAETPKQWFDLLRIKTSLGQIQLTGKTDFKPRVIIETVDYSGNIDSDTFYNCDYYFPHFIEIDQFTAHDIEDIDLAIAKIRGSSEEKWKSLSDEYKNLNAVYHIWNHDDLLRDDFPYSVSKKLNEKQIELIKRHNISVYGCFLNKVQTLDTFNDEYLKLRKSYRALSGGLQLATDRMAQGELLDIPLKRFIGYQRHTHIIVHFNDGNPDLGRKTFQPEKIEIAKILAEEVTKILITYRKHTQVDDTAIPLAATEARDQWLDDQWKHLEKNPLKKSDQIKNVSIMTEPAKEQDVIALFHELIGCGLLRGYEIVATDQHKQYDSVLQINYSDGSMFYSEGNKIGISRKLFEDSGFTFPQILRKKILEYKYDYLSLVEDVVNKNKYHNHINLVVAWCCSNYEKTDEVELVSLLDNDKGRDQRQFFGSTHKAFQVGSSIPVYEMILLKDLLEYIDTY